MTSLNWITIVSQLCFIDILKNKSFMHIYNGNLSKYNVRSDPASQKCDSYINNAKLG